MSTLYYIHVYKNINILVVKMKRKNSFRIKNNFLYAVVYVIYIIKLYEILLTKLRFNKLQ